MPRITISYRRDDSGVITGRIFDRLAAHFGREAVFRDIDNIPPGVDFRRHIDQVLDESDIILAIVGPKWVGPRAGQSRLASAADPVRLEIETALRKDKPLIPVLVLRAAMPRPEQLPETLNDFAYRNAVQVDAGQDFDHHIGRLIRAMERILEIEAEEEATEGVAAAAAAIEAAPSFDGGDAMLDRDVPGETAPVPELAASSEDGTALEACIASQAGARGREHQTAELGEEIRLALLAAEQEAKVLTEQLIAEGDVAGSRATKISQLEGQLDERDRQIEELSNELIATRAVQSFRGVRLHWIAIVVLAGAFLAALAYQNATVNQQDADLSRLRARLAGAIFQVGVVNILGGDHAGVRVVQSNDSRFLIGDIISGVGNASIKNVDDYIAATKSAINGTIVPIVIWREGRLTSFSITLK